MELEFDKEIDAILRKARSGIGAVSTAAASTHLDADTIAAFAEIALPQRTKLVYIEHFADCDSCRKHLSHAMKMNKEVNATAASPISAPVAEELIPWYQSLFKTQNLALTMGALVLTFSGVLAYLVSQNREQAGNSAISQVTESEAERGSSAPGFETLATNSNVVAKDSDLAKNTASAANAPATSSVNAMSPSAQPRARPDSADDIPGVKDNSFVLDGSSSVPAKPEVAAAPPPVEAAVAERDEDKSDAKNLKEENRQLQLAKRKQNQEMGRSRDAPPPAAKMGPSRSGPLQNQTNQSNNSGFDMAVTRSVGGKTFNNRNGAWYDAAYRGQTTTSFRRGTEEYKKLDRGLRNIADDLGGTVVLLWKDKAYRIR